MWNYLADTATINGAPIIDRVFKVPIKENSSCDDEEEEEIVFNDPEIKEHIHDYWDFITSHLGDLDTVKFINFQHKKSADASNVEKGLRWLILSLYKTDDLKQAMLKMWSERDFLLLYDIEHSFMWRYRNEILGALETVA